MRPEVGAAFLFPVIKHARHAILKKVSRSFYLSLRLLPDPMREAAALSYLLARTSDTIADSPGVDILTRMACLKEFSKQIQGVVECRPWPSDLVSDVLDAGERELLMLSPKLIEWTKQLPHEQLVLVLEVLMTIIEGQNFDLEAFGHGSEANPAVMQSTQRLDQYTYQVAGCVGEFWTRLGRETLADDFSPRSMDDLLGLGRDYGKGLQLVNILRDLPRDLKAGRCYLPVIDPKDQQLLLAEYRSQWSRAAGLIANGLAYASSLKGRRLRMASVLPALLAEETLALLAKADWKALELGVKIPRRRVYSKLLQSLFF